MLGLCTATIIVIAVVLTMRRDSAMVQKRTCSLSLKQVHREIIYGVLKTAHDLLKLDESDCLKDHAQRSLQFFVCV